jgi:hypothetical protein
MSETTNESGRRTGILPVFDRGRSVGSSDPGARFGLSHVSGFAEYGTRYQARRTDRDRAPPRSTVTAILMGDPKPGRSALAMSKAST